MIQGLVSTIIPVYNRPVQLREAVESVLLQDYRPIEIVIVDDGSTDGETRAAGQALAKSNPIEVKVLSRPNGGAGLARETGRLAADGEYIQYLDSDDVLLPGKFSAQVTELQKQPDAHVAYGFTRFRHANGSVVPAPWKGSGTQKTTMFPSFLNERWWDTPNPLYRASICDRAGSWSPLRLEEDWEYDCRIASLGARLAWCQQFVCEVRDHSAGRLSRGEALDARRLRERARSHELIWQHARTAQLEVLAPGEVQKFSRSLFLLARQCGAAGLADESRNLFALAREAAGSQRAGGLDFRIYALGARILGWYAAGKLSAGIDILKFRPARKNS